MYDNNAVNEVKLKNKISILDSYKFSTIKSVCKCFDRKKIPVRSSFFQMEHDGTLNDEYMLWCPKYAKHDGIGFVPPNGDDWINILDTPNLGEIYESNIDHSKNKITSSDHMEKLRICFMGHEIPNHGMYYIFRGIYKFKEQKEDNGARIYKRVDESIETIPFSNHYNNFSS